LYRHGSATDDPRCYSRILLSCHPFSERTQWSPRLLVPYTLRGQAAAAAAEWEDTSMRPCVDLDHVLLESNAITLSCSIPLYYSLHIAADVCSAEPALPPNHTLSELRVYPFWVFVSLHPTWSIISCEPAKHPWMPNVYTCTCIYVAQASPMPLPPDVTS